MTKSLSVFARLACICVAVAGSVSAAGGGMLRAGAAKVDVTLPENLFPFEQDGPPSMGLGVRAFVGVHDKTWARAIVVDNGTTSVAIVALDLEKVPNPGDMIKRISEASNIAPERIVVSATHTHNEPITEPTGRETTPKWKAYYEGIANGAVKAVVSAKKALQPARMGYGAGNTYINVNTGEETGSPMGSDASAPSDKTVAVLKFETPAGAPIGLLINYAIQSEAAFRALTRKDGYEISGDIAGIASSLVEEHYQNKVVALFTMAAAGDQKPQYAGRYVMAGSNEAVDYGPATWAIVEMQARRLAEESVRVAGATRAASAQARIWGAQTVVTCPGQRASGETGSSEYKTQPRDPVQIRLGLVAIHDVALAAVGGELATRIGQRVRNEGPLVKTIVVTQAGGSVGYILQDSSYLRFSHAVGSSPLKPGCAEAAIVNSFKDLTERYMAEQ